jgi:hypothetical protein
MRIGETPARRDLPNGQRAASDLTAESFRSTARISRRPGRCGTADPTAAAGGDNWEQSTALLLLLLLVLQQDHSSLSELQQVVEVFCGEEKCASWFLLATLRLARAAAPGTRVVWVVLQLLLASGSGF